MLSAPDAPGAGRDRQKRDRREHWMKRAVGRDHAHERREHDQRHQRAASKARIVPDVGAAPVCRERFVGVACQSHLQFASPCTSRPTFNVVIAGFDPAIHSGAVMTT